MSSLVIYADREMQDLDAECAAVIGGATTALTDGTDYSIQNTGLDARGHPVGAHHFVYLIQTASEPATAEDLKRARAGAGVLTPNGDPIGYSKETGLTGYIWSPYGEVSVSVNEAP